jgi:hypothetical protein
MAAVSDNTEIFHSDEEDYQMQPLAGRETTLSKP